MDLTPTQLIALNELKEALDNASACGLLDDLAEGYAHPDTVNDFCDAIKEMLEDS